MPDPHRRCRQRLPIEHGKGGPHQIQHCCQSQHPGRSTQSKRPYKWNGGVHEQSFLVCRADDIKTGLVCRAACVLPPLHLSLRFACMYQCNWLLQLRMLWVVAASSSAAAPNISWTSASIWALCVDRVLAMFVLLNIVCASRLITQTCC